jgi:hypothetical protein
MRKKYILLYATLTVALTMVIAPLAIAKHDTRLNGDVYIEFQQDFNPPSQPYSFIGTVSGDIEGTLYVALIDVWFDPAGVKVEHFVEEWRIEPESGGYIEGENVGKWTFSNFKWVGNGEVTGASVEYANLIGSKWQYSGTTNSPDEVPLEGYGTWHITHNK